MYYIQPIIYLFFGLCCCSLLSSGSSLYLEVDTNYGNDSKACLTSSGNAVQPCKSLEYITMKICNDSKQSLRPYSCDNLIVTIVSSELVLNNLVSLINVSNFTIQGTGTNDTFLVCDTKFGAGLLFDNCSDLNLIGFTMKNCTSAFKHSWGLYQMLHGSVFVINSRDISITNISVQNSSGHGLALINNIGIVRIQSSDFTNNFCHQKQECSNHFSNSKILCGGLILAVNGSARNKQYTANYAINDCKFINNSANINVKKFSSIMSGGGGLSAILLQGAVDNNITITNSFFNQNKAKIGGGISFTLASNAQNNTILVQNSSIVRNTACDMGGGVNSAIETTESEPPMNNIIRFINCSINSNTAYYGAGGLDLYTNNQLSTSIDPDNRHIFQTCWFEKNKAINGAAVHIRNVKLALLKNSHHLTKNYFENCSFIGNEISEEENHTLTQSGIFFISHVTTYFNEDNMFVNNTGTALYIEHARVHFKNTSTTFKGNEGIRGGAIFIVGEASLHLTNNNWFLFDGNSGSYGGAICIEQLPHYHSGSCFIEKDNDSSNNVLEFMNNTANTGVAHDIYISDLLPCCLSSCLCDNSKLDTIFNSSCLVTFVFSNSTDSIATAPSTLTITQDSVSAFPGLPVTLDILKKDQLGSTNINKLFSTSIFIFPKPEKRDNIFVDDRYKIVWKKTTRINGQQGNEGEIVIHTNNIKPLKVFTKVTLLDCPPGFSFNEKEETCECSVNRFILSCERHHEKHHAAVRKGFWVGYMSNDSINSNNLGFGICANELCTFNHSPVHFGGHDLPKNATNLEDAVCGPTRRGVLCGSCKEGYTVYFHSPYYTCGRVTGSCQYGIALYLLSDIVPVTVIFLVIIFFNIHLTSGWLYSFMFYAQSLQILGVDAFKTIHYEGYNKVIVQIYRIFYGIFNLDILETESLSFCIHENMNVMSVFLIQYATIIYSFLLIFCTLLAIRLYFHYNCCRKILNQAAPTNISMINGLTAFVVMSYFKCIDITYKLNILIKIYNSDSTEPNTTVPLFAGDFEYWGQEHLQYVIPGLIVFVIVVMPPPLLLLLESVLIKVNKFPKFQVSRIMKAFIQFRSKVFPFLDSFQGCFKDNCRCFAGLFFLYRILLISGYLYANRPDRAYIGSEMMLFVILLVHLIFQPFQKPWQNKLDIFLLTNLLAINFLTLNQYYRVILHHSSQSELQMFFYLQALLMGMPLIYICGYLCYRMNRKYGILKKIRSKFLSKLIKD